MSFGHVTRVAHAHNESPEQILRHHQSLANSVTHPQAIPLGHVQNTTAVYGLDTQSCPQDGLSSPAGTGWSSASRAVHNPADQGQSLVEVRPNSGRVGCHNMGATGLVGRMPSTDDHPRHGPRAKTESKEKQRKIARHAHIEQREHRCLHCALDPGKRGCFNYPLCDRCRGFEEQCTLEDPQTAYFLNMHYWFEHCQALNHTSNAKSDHFPVIQNTAIHDGPIRMDIPDPIMLEFNFHDRMLSSPTTTNIVLMCPDEQAMDPNEDNPMHTRAPRAPALDQPGLDRLIRTTVWGQALWQSNGAKLTPEEIRLWDLARSFTGYFTMLHNQGSTRVEASDLRATSMLGRIQAELVYSLGYHLQRLYFEIVNFPIDELIRSDSKTSAAVVLYTFEVLCRLMLSMQNTDWQLNDERLLHPLKLLQDYLNQRAKHILHQFRLLQCLVSGHLNGNRQKKALQMKPLPLIVRFARALDDKRFPRQCVITASRYSAVLPPSIVCPWTNGTKHRGMDLLLNPTTDVLAMLGAENVHELLPLKQNLTDDNTIMSLNPLAPLPHGFESNSGSSVGSLVESERTDSNVTELTARLLALDQGVHLAEYQSETASPGDLPSLANSSPISIDSPFTPNALIHTTGYPE